MGRNGRPLTLDKRKIKALFPAMLIAPQIKYIAYALGVQKTDTIRSWIASGEALQEQFSEYLEPLEDLFPFEYEAFFENRKLEFDAEFRMLHELEPETKIPDRLYNDYNQFMLKSKRKFIEDNISRKEKDILDNIELSKDKELDEQFKLLIRFARIYHRGICVNEIGYLTNINKHAGTSKNVGLSLKMLEKMNKEDFADSQLVEHTGSIDVNTKSILSLALKSEREEKEKLLTSNNENIIEIEQIKQIEYKDKE